MTDNQLFFKFWETLAQIAGVDVPKLGWRKAHYIEIGGEMVRAEVEAFHMKPGEKPYTTQVIECGLGTGKGLYAVRRAYSRVNTTYRDECSIGGREKMESLLVYAKLISE